jgi:hypothetical protein
VSFSLARAEDSFSRALIFLPPHARTLFSAAARAKHIREVIAHREGLIARVAREV